MLTISDIEYRKIHGTVPQLDQTNNRNRCFEYLPKTPVIHSQYASMGNVLRSANVGKVAGGIGNAFMGMIHLAAGDATYGLGKMGSGLVSVATGAIDPNRTAIDGTVAKYIQDAEVEAWNIRQFLATFNTASGFLGETYLRDGSGDDFHCGNGYEFMENGDYFEGAWEDGEHAFGVYIWANGERYIGNLRGGLKLGAGLTLYTNGTCYNGNHENGLRNGIGAIWYLDGAYCGNWSNDVRHGYGGCRYADGTSFLGDWNNDVPIG